MTFVDTVLTYLKGDKEEIKAMKIAKKVSSLLRIRIAQEENEILRCTEDIEVAKVLYNAVLVNNGKLEFDDNNFVNNLIDAQQAIKDKESLLERHKKTLEFLKGELDVVSK